MTEARKNGLQRPAAAPALLLAGLLAALGVTPGRADDTELFLSSAGDGAGSGRANVLFIIDTSGSMATEVGTQAPWNPATRFTGCYRSDAVYFSANGARPACDSGDYLPKAANACAAARSQLDQVGYFSGSLLGWNPGARRWEALAGGATDRPLECQADRGIDGGPGDSGSFAADGDRGPWDGSPDQEPTWDARYTLYDGNWLNWSSNPPTVTRTRLEIVKGAVSDLVGTLENVNVGIMRFNRANGGAVIQPVSPIEDTRQTLLSVVNGLDAADSTPLSEALYEATQYFRGGQVFYGNASPILSVAGSRTGNNASATTYRSPVSDTCSRNFIVLLTDGEPSQDSGAITGVTAALPGFATVTGRSACDGSGDGACLDDLAQYLSQGDLDATAEGQQNVVVHTIGFELDLPLLAETARRGGGEYHLADDTASLASALSGIVLSIFENASSFAAPAVPVNAFNRSQNAGDVFLSVFAPSDRVRWPGNLKKYRLVDGVLVGQNGQPALDDRTGLFRRTAFSFWSDAPDGGDVRAGGAASQLPDWTERDLFTDDSQDPGGQEATLVPASNIANIPAEWLRVPAADRQAVLEWALGRDVADVDGDGDTADTRRDMGDPLHTQPVSLTYGGTAQNPDTVVFVSTNDGFLHAFDGEDGSEKWAYVPGELLPRLYSLYRNEPAGGKSYGLDGELVLYVENDDGRPGFTGSEKAWLLFGMGRGGRSVYALDVTDPEAPRLEWRIVGGSEGFEDLGLTWARPVIARVDAGDGPRDVVVLSGGYDSGQDGSTYRTQDTQGHALYLVDLATGTRLWSAGSATVARGTHDLRLERLEHSIPAAPRVLDTNQDGLADRLYVGDTGGRLWRFDIVNGAASTSELVEGGLLATLGAADLGGTRPASEIRRFYETPDVVPLVRGGQLILVVNLGSGHRGHPLDTTIEDSFFSVRDFNAIGVLDSNQYPPPVTASQLLDITDDAAPNLPLSAAGWRLRMVQGRGEKILGESVTLRNNVFFTSFTPGERASACVAGFGTNRLYQVSLLDGSPLTNLDGSTDDLDLTVSDRSMILSQTGVGLEPALFFDRPAAEGPDGDSGSLAGTVSVCVAGTCRTLSVGATGRTYWFEDQRDDQDE